MFFGGNNLSDGELKKRMLKSATKSIKQDGSISMSLIYKVVDSAKKDFLKVFERYIYKEFPEYEQYLIAIEECFEKWFGNIPEYDVDAKKWFGE